MKLYYKQPAEQWEQTLPIGNGSLGAMIWGTHIEQLGINEESLWSGYYRDKNNYDAINYLDTVRQHVLNEEYDEAGQCVRDLGVLRPQNDGTVNPIGPEVAGQFVKICPDFRLEG